MNSHRRGESDWIESDWIDGGGKLVKVELTAEQKLNNEVGKIVREETASIRKEMPIGKQIDDSVLPGVEAMMKAKGFA